MLRQTMTGIRRPNLPTLAQLQQHRGSLPVEPPEPQPEHHIQHPEPEAGLPIPTSPRPPANPHLAGAALHGLAGQAVRIIAPHTEAHPAAILLQFLAVFGNLLGRGPHCMVDATRHTLNLYLVLVGDSSKARKGTSWSQIARLFAEVDQAWLAARVTTARLTTAGLIQALPVDDQPADRRLLALSEEFAAVLHTLKRGNASLSSLLRCAWDSGHLPAVDMHHQRQTPAAHLTLIAHITQRELAQNLPRTEAHNGFANRCLWAWVHRSHCLPEGGTLAAGDLIPITRELRSTLDWAAASPEILFRRDAEARDLWRDRYAALSQLEPGLRGAATSRAEAQVLRLSAIYAALDSTSTIGLPHLQAALAVWDYCSASAALLFGISTGDPIADRIREAIEVSADGLSKYQIRRLFHGHVEANRIDAALETLVALGALSAYSEHTGGRPSLRWSLVQNDELEESEPGQNDQLPAEPMARDGNTDDTF